jgi:PhoD-like phosphatase, N-terminal domain/PhoD-like phosphatase
MDPDREERAMEPHPQNHMGPAATVTRRLFLAGAAAGTAGLLVERMPGAWAAPARAKDDPFTLGVASGDPTPTGVVLWTRLAPRPLEPDGGMPGRPVPVQWEVATGPRLHNVVRRGEALAHPRFAHSVHVEVDGLEPGRTYWYRFRAAGHLSRAGRTRTAPDPGRPLGRLDLAVVSCQSWESGFYTAYRHLAEDDVDLVLHLGDYIYENAPRPGRPRIHPGGEATDLPSYRARHALYKTDPTSRRPTPATRSWSPSTTTRSRTTTPAATPPPATRPRSCAAGPPPTGRPGSTCRCAGRPGGRPCPCTGGCGSATWPRSTCSTPASTATTTPVIRAAESS